MAITVGEFSNFELVELIQNQIHSLSSESRKLSIAFANGYTGAIYFTKGTIPYAEIKTENGQLTNEQAIYLMLEQNSGSFRIVEGASPPAISITNSAMNILLEGLRLLDEKKSTSGSDTSSQKLSPPIVVLKNKVQKYDFLLSEIKKIKGITSIVITLRDGSLQAEYNSHSPEKTALLLASIYHRSQTQSFPQIGKLNKFILYFNKGKMISFDEGVFLLLVTLDNKTAKTHETIIVTKLLQCIEKTINRYTET